MEVEMHLVSSTNVTSLGYSELEEILYVRFNNQRLYCYFGVPVVEFDSLLSVSSVGKYLYNNIYPFYNCERLE